MAAAAAAAAAAAYGIGSKGGAILGGLGCLAPEPACEGCPLLSCGDAMDIPCCIAAAEGTCIKDICEGIAPVKEVIGNLPAEGLKNITLGDVAPA